MANVLFSRTDSPSTKPITDGQIIFDTSGNGKMYLDNGTTRLEMGGAIDVDTTLDATSTNPIQNKGVAGVMLSELEEVRGTTKKGFLTDALATKILDAKIGTIDISSIGDGTVTGAISDVNSKLTNAFVNSSPNIKIAYYTWSGHVVGGTTTNFGRFDHVIPDGCTFIGMLLTPRCTVDITLSHYGTDIYGTSKDFTGDIYYDVLIIYAT